MMVQRIQIADSVLFKNFLKIHFVMTSYYFCICGFVVVGKDDASNLQAAGEPCIRSNRAGLSPAGLCASSNHSR